MQGVKDKFIKEKNQRKSSSKMLKRKNTISKIKKNLKKKNSVESLTNVMDQGGVRTSDLEDKGKKFEQFNKDKDKIRKWWQRNTTQHIKADPLH